MKRENLRARRQTAQTVIRPPEENTITARTNRPTTFLDFDNYFHATVSIPKSQSNRDSDLQQKSTILQISSQPDHKQEFFKTLIAKNSTKASGLIKAFSACTGKSTIFDPVQHRVTMMTNIKQPATK
jgi:hypothetical protein